jgi:Cu-Zn family superoxide dismutase
MRVAVGVKLVVVGTLLCAACKEDDQTYFYPEASMPPPGDAGADAAKPDTGAPVNDSGSGNDAGASADTGAPAADSGASDAGGGDASNVIATGMGAWTLYDNPYGDGGANPATGIQGSAMAVKAGDGGMTVSLSVSGLPGDRGFGSHVHKLECPPPTSAGGHFQHNANPDGGVNDPAFANPMNEVWLDFTTNEAGIGMGSATVDFVPPAGGAKAIIVHDKLTGDGGLAGPKLACLPFPF